MNYWLFFLKHEYSESPYASDWTGTRPSAQCQRGSAAVPPFSGLFPPASGRGAEASSSPRPSHAGPLASLSAASIVAEFVDFADGRTSRRTCVWSILPLTSSGARRQMWERDVERLLNLEAAKGAAGISLSLCFPFQLDRKEQEEDVQRCCQQNKTENSYKNRWPTATPLLLCELISEAQTAHGDLLFFPRAPLRGFPPTVPTSSPVSSSSSSSFFFFSSCPVSPLTVPISSPAARGGRGHARWGSAGPGGKLRRGSAGGALLTEASALLNPET